MLFGIEFSFYYALRGLHLRGRSFSHTGLAECGVRGLGCGLVAGSGGPGRG